MSCTHRYSFLQLSPATSKKSSDDDDDDGEDDEKMSISASDVDPERLKAFNVRFH